MKKASLATVALSTLVIVASFFVLSVSAVKAQSASATSYTGNTYTGLTSNAQGSTVINFEDLPSLTTVDYSPIPSLYAGLKWTNFSYWDTTGYGYSHVAAVTYTNYSCGFSNGATSPTKEAFNTGGAQSSIATSTGSTAFDLLSANLTAVYSDGLQVTAKGYLNGVLKYNNTYTITYIGQPTQTAFNYANVDRVDFTSSGGTHHSSCSLSGTQFAIDDVVVNLQSAPTTPTLTNISPTTVNAGSSFNLTLTGTGFSATGNYVLLNGPSTISLNNISSNNGGTTMLVTMPSMAIGTYAVSTFSSSTGGSGTVSSANTSNSLTLAVKDLKVAPSNLTAIITSNPGEVALSWKNNSSSQTGVSIERSSPVQSFTQIANITGATSASYTDTGLLPEVSYKYRVRATFSDGSFSAYSNTASVTMDCLSASESDTSKQLKSAYDKLPENVTGKISIPSYLSTVAALNSGDIKKKIADAELPGKSLKEGLNVGLLGMASLKESTREKAVKAIVGSVEKLGKAYNLSPEETALLFSAMLSGDAPFTIVSFTFDPGSILKLGFGSKIVYQAKKDTSAPWPKCINLDTTVMSKILSAAPAPSVGNVKPATGTSATNTFNVSGSGFDTNGNIIKLIPVSLPSSLGPSPVLGKNNRSVLDVTWNFFKSLTPKADAQTTSGNTSGNTFYEIDDVSSNGSSLTFSVATTTPDGTYMVSVSGFDSPWTDTPYTITVSGNGAGDPTTAAEDSQVIIGVGTLPPDSVAATALTAKATAKGQASLNWTDNSLVETAFLLERAPSASATFTQIASLPANTISYLDAGLPPSTAYQYRLRARLGDGTYSPYTSIAKVTTLAKPATPVVKVKAASTRSINIGWSDTDSLLIKGYTLTKTTPAPINTLLVNISTTTYQSTGLSASTKYCYAVSGLINPVNRSATSTPLCATTLAPTVAISLQSPSPVRGNASFVVNISGLDDISHVDLYVSATKVFSIVTSPWTFSFNSATVANGSHTVYALVYEGVKSFKTNTLTITTASPLLNISGISCTYSITPQGTKNYDSFAFTGAPQGGLIPYTYSLKNIVSGTSTSSITVKVPGTYSGSTFYNKKLDSSYLLVTSTDKQTASTTCTMFQPQTVSSTSKIENNSFMANVLNAIKKIFFGI